MITRIRTLLQPPIFVDDAEKGRVAVVLNAAILVTLAIALSLTLLLLLFSVDNRALYLYTLPVVGINLLGLGLVRRGYIRLTAMLIVLFALGMTFGSSLIFGGVNEANLIGYVSIVLFGTLILGRRGLLLVSTLSFVAWIASHGLQTAGLLSARLPFTSETGMVVNTLVFLFIIGFVYLVAHNQEDTLRQARISAQALRETIAELRATTISRGYLDNIIRSMGDMLIVVGPDARIELVNRATERILGYRAEELIGQPVEMLFAEDFREGRGIATIIMQGTSEHREKALKARDGQIIPVLLSGQLMRTDSEEARVVCIAQDITALKEAAEAVERERDFAVQIMNALGQGITVTDQAQRFEYVNPAYAQMLGYAVEDLIGRSPREFTPPEDHPILDTAQEARAQGKSSTYETNLRRSDGRLLRVLITGVARRKGDEISGSIAVVTDLAGAQEIEHSLRESEARNRALLNAIPDWMFLQNREGIYLDYHPGQGDLLRFPHDIKGRSLFDVMPPEIQPVMAETFQRAIKTNKVQRAEFDFPMGERLCHCEIRVVAYDTDRVLTIVRDITDRKQAEQQTLDLARERERTQLLADFIRDISHDFRTPLSVINTSLYLLKRHPDQERQEHHLAVMERQSAHIVRLIDAMIVMMRLDSEAHFNFQKMSINTLIRMAEGHWLSLAESRQITLLFDQDNTLPPVKLDMDEMGRALGNLVENAVQFTPGGGHIIVRTCRENAFVVVQVRDNGMGIAEDVLPQVFDRFFRGDPARSTETGGVGLGLPIARKIIEMHGGTISIESAVGEGTTVSVNLPID